MRQPKLRPGAKLPIPTPKRAGKYTITKIDAAVRQLETAIELWASDGDFVSIYTLSHSAHEILYQINKGHKTPCKSLADPDPNIFSEEGVRLYKAAFKMNYNFSKHGGANPRELHRYAVGNISCVIFDCIYIHNQLRFPLRAVFEAFFDWLLMTEPELFGKTLHDFGLNRRIVKKLTADGKKAFMDKAVGNLSMFRPRGSSVFHFRWNK